MVGDLKKILHTFFQVICHRGVYSNLSFAFNFIIEWLWFVSHRKSSFNLMNMNLIEKDLANKAHSTFYIPTPIIPFFKLIKSLDLPSRSVFVDYGAGKGRAMILAMECGAFYKVKGLEFSPGLFNLAKKNIQNYIQKTGKNDFHLMNQDVVNYSVHLEDNFFYFFHPFDETILSSCLKSIYQSLRKNPRKVFLVYQSNYKNWTDYIVAGGFFQKPKTFVSFGTRFYIYEHKPH